MTSIVVMLEGSAKRHFTDSTIASYMVLWARGIEPCNARKPMLSLSFDNSKYVELRSASQEGFDSLEWSWNRILHGWIIDGLYGSSEVPCYAEGPLA